MCAQNRSQATTQLITTLIPRINRAPYNTEPAVRVYDPSPEDLKIALESYLAAGRPPLIDKCLLYGNDALDYMQGSENQSDEGSL